ncbi:YncE family protein [Engelhardtia mirabilis]|uniref:SbsA Ig-like domain-containing protein n=1 Tax=Engelhardtia mirabilis TaxID=2528011 RepID=A0A518BMZ7_9BACT|nr:hypothetical protein Pla133_34410 [Planctomycetes bacterium Pla133]QDV02671.1 hypothetical protein Pla86_34400 [Planctomycetes bacterium Pla86]
MHSSHGRSLAAALLVTVAAPTALAYSAPGSLAPSPQSGGPQLDLVQVGNGFGSILPHRIFKLAGGGPGSQVIEIRSVADLVENLAPANPVLPGAVFGNAALLPDGSAGNHYLVVEFSSALDVGSVLVADAGAASPLKSGLSLVSIDPATGLSTPVGAAAFVGGQGYLNPDPATPGKLLLETHVGPSAGASGLLALTPQGVGFPYTQSGSSPGAQVLIAPSSLVLVADTDGDLSTHETFPAGAQLALRLEGQVTSQQGATLGEPVLASTTVGADQQGPALLHLPTASGGEPAIEPAEGAVDVDPSTDVVLTFTESLQPATLGQLANGAAPGLSPALSIAFGPLGNQISVPFTILPAGPYDLATWHCDLAYDLPGMGGAGGACGGFSSVDVQLDTAALQDLAQNTGQQAVSSFFDVGQGVGLVNAPVAPDAIYVVRADGGASVSVIDLNGFGAGTGNPTFDPANPIVKGNSNYPNNPNLAIQGALLTPPLAPGNCTFNGGSAGVFTLTLDSNLDDRLLRAPQVDSIADMALGQPLDLVFNNGPPPFGCQSGTPNLCATAGLKLVNPVLSGDGLVPALPGQFSNPSPGVGNIISWAPHPNPPPLVFPAPCSAPLIGAQEPTSVVSAIFSNLLVPGPNPLGVPAQGVPPGDLLAGAQSAFFQGPGDSQTSVAACEPYQIRQQVGHFLYLVDAMADEVVVVNSNRFTVLDRIDVGAPTHLAVAPNLNLLAVTSQSMGRVSFVDIDPASTMFHEVVSSVDLTPGISDVVWQPDGEDVLVVNGATHELVVISAFNLQVRKVLSTVAAQVRQPFAIAVGNRQTNFGLGRGVYFAYVLGRNGRVCVYESGPGGINAIGSDSVLSVDGLSLASPKDLRIDPASLSGAVWVAHEQPLDPATGVASGQQGGALTRLELTTRTLGPLPVGGSSPTTLADRKLELAVSASIGEEVLTGIPVSISFDELVNLGGLRPPASAFAAAQPIAVNSKSLVRQAGIQILPTREPHFLFAAVADSSQGGGVVDVIDLQANLRPYDTDPFLAGTQSIPVPGVALLVDWFGQ